MNIEHTKKHVWGIIIFIIIIAVLISIAMFVETSSVSSIFSQVITLQMSVIFLLLFVIINFLLVINFLYTIYTQNKKTLENIEKEKHLDRAKNEFISLISHQLRTPLAAINWYTEALISEDTRKINEEQKNYLSRLHDSSQRMTSLVNSIVDVSRIELHTFITGKKPTILFPLIETIINSFNQQIKKKKILIHKKYDSHLRTVYIDQRYIQMILEHLLSNSIKYVPIGGEIDIAVACKNNTVHMAVTDNGYGIPKEELSFIFSKMFRATNILDKEPSGTGIGLYIVKSIVDYAGGKISVTSTENVGTTFSVVLPAPTK